METSTKEFVMKHVVEDVMNIEDSKEVSFDEDHFNIHWELSLSRNAEFFSLTLKGPMSFAQNVREIEAKVSLKVISTSGRSLIVEMDYQFGNPFNLFRPCKWEDFISRKKLDEEYIVDKKVAIEACVIIKKMTGFGKEDLRKFDESIEELSDISFVVKDRKFYLLKMFLALQSSYFKSLLLGNFNESQKSEIVLEGINPEDFQNFLELIHGEDAIDNVTIDGILHLADMYDAPTAIKRCEKFLLEKSNKTLKSKLEMSIRYSLNALKEKCLSEVQTVAEIRSVLPDNIDEMDPSLAKALLQKSLALH
ncbi:hypothetical protein GCK72_007506 [Caenorhabditis remanei]|uniref:BTB domain-containing protein n=1 Tax=Caenorhabditis remanei TaxID=31234 RepID=A0A6A5HM91_CAERE|nr:hypothetical protein GCK72_007506 [Caenorhabditis remanei]KAF1767547.1 hypothetical protein GCK72_007506 [Caenorhabditis remanei]